MAEELFTSGEKQEISDAIKSAEKETSGEIRVHIEKNCKEDVLDRASGLFDMLEMQKTELRNGVLIYLAVEDKQMAIIGDGGINAKVSESFWDSTRDIMIKHFKEGNFTKGLVEGIQQAGQQLKQHFPYKSDDKNELDDEISFGK